MAPVRSLRMTFSHVSAWSDDVDQVRAGQRQPAGLEAVAVAGDAVFVDGGSMVRRVRLRAGAQTRRWAGRLGRKYRRRRRKPPRHSALYYTHANGPCWHSRAAPRRCHRVFASTTLIDAVKRGDAAPSARSSRRRRRRQRAGRRRVDGAALGGPARRRRDGRPAARRRRGRQGRDALQDHAAVARVHERQRARRRSAAQGRRRSERRRPKKARRR